MTSEIALRGIARELKKTMRCNCDLDNWEPEKSTGHSHVCGIHKAALNEWRYGPHTIIKKDTP